jgi:hypothetical protein
MSWLVCKSSKFVTPSMYLENAKACMKTQCKHKISFQLSKSIITQVQTSPYILNKMKFIEHLPKALSYLFIFLRIIKFHAHGE